MSRHLENRSRRWTSPRSTGCPLSDDGIVIVPEKLPRIFEEFYRTNEAVRHNKESSGLGLPIVRNIARLHGLRLSVTSRPGGGATFDVRLLRPSGTPAASVQDIG